MKKSLLIMMIVSCFISCNNDSDIDVPVKKERTDILLTKSEGEIAAKNNEFAFDLLKKVAEKGDNANIFISPLSVTAAFSMLNNGANGATQQEIQDVLGFSGFNPQDVNEFYLKMLEATTEIDPQVKIMLANSVWIHDEFPVLPSFTEVTKEYYDAEIRNLDFSAPHAPTTINQWVSGKTNGQIPTLIDRIDSSVMMYLINTLYFKGEWKEPFLTKETQNEPFTNQDGNQTQTPLMHKSFSNQYISTDDYAITTLPYGNGAFEMVFLLPHEGVQLNAVIPELTGSYLQECLEEKRQFSQIDFKLPRFKVEYDHLLNEPLRSLGMELPFNENADFSAITPEPVCISRVLHKTFIEVNEKGIEASAGTAIEMIVTSPGPATEIVQFHLDRPFLYFIREISTGTIFFMGTINQL